MIAKYTAAVLTVAGMLMGAAPARAQSELSWWQRWRMSQAQSQADSFRQWGKEAEAAGPQLDALQRELNSAVIGESSTTPYHESFVRERARVEWSVGNGPFDSGWHLTRSHEVYQILTRLEYGFYGRTVQKFTWGPEWLELAGKLKRDMWAPNDGGRAAAKSRAAELYTKLVSRLVIARTELAASGQRAAQSAREADLKVDYYRRLDQSRSTAGDVSLLGVR